MVDLYYFTALIFADADPCAHYVLYYQAYFVGLIFVVRRSSSKLRKLDPSKISHYTVYYLKLWLDKSLSSLFVIVSKYLLCEYLIIQSSHVAS